MAAERIFQILAAEVFDFDGVDGIQRQKK